MENIKTFEEHLDSKYGKKGSEKRNEFEFKSKIFMMGEMLKELRISSKMTQQQLAEKTGTKKSYISKLENGKVDIQISTLYKLIEDGLDKKLNFVIK